MDEILSEIRRVRREIVSEHRDDLHALCQALRKREAAHPERVVDLARLKQEAKQAR